jgi:hypothetical protein
VTEQHEPAAPKCRHGRLCTLEPVSDKPGWVKPVANCFACDRDGHDDHLAFLPGTSSGKEEPKP